MSLLSTKVKETKYKWLPALRNSLTKEWTKSANKKKITKSTRETYWDVYWKTHQKSTDKMAGNKHWGNGLPGNRALYKALISLATGPHQSVHQTKGKISSSSTGNRTKKHTETKAQAWMCYKIGTKTAQTSLYVYRSLKRSYIAWSERKPWQTSWSCGM